MKKESIFIAENISIGYRQNQADIKTIHSLLNFSLFKGELTCLLGPNGAGKSTLLRTLSTMQAPLTGNIYLLGKALKDYKEYEISRLIGVVLTDKIYAGGLTVAELVSLGRHPYTGFFGKLNKKDKEIIEKALSITGIIDKASHYVSQLSDGERQKVMIAKALAQECPIVLLDEPTAFLDIPSRIDIMLLLHQLAHDENKAILLSTHDTDLALLLSDRLWLLSRDKGLQSGFTEDIVLSGEMDRLFSRPNIFFNKENGSFRPQIYHHQTPVRVDAKGELSHWLKNLLQKNGFMPVSDKNTCTNIHISANQKDNISIEIDNEKYTVHSFEEIIPIIEYTRSMTD
ncbi:ABC transporter ATP-binding protein [Coprobacter secundus]|uniref:Iron(III) ABC transporter ATP-binding protein n=1 Tax=Coprobacter secundus subsp. similis TaxID=2751153 RepID=A0A7G1HZ31_9BACT|nr:ABC transporter ATP-binding protein [Coprobacter secundus]BCI64293.1 iron(III) ABC transporter ATP-binding protein [Coprobacter secundus subsp. similis]CCY39068.1 iron(III) ABC transporter ATP-binding protein [Tannerella sp. CAG:118]